MCMHGYTGVVSALCIIAADKMYMIVLQRSMVFIDMNCYNSVLIVGS